MVLGRLPQPIKPYITEMHYEVIESETDVRPHGTIPKKFNAVQEAFEPEFYRLQKRRIWIDYTTIAYHLEQTYERYQERVFNLEVATFGEGRQNGRVIERVKRLELFLFGRPIGTWPIATRVSVLEKNMYGNNDIILK